MYAMLSNFLTFKSIYFDIILTAMVAEIDLIASVLMCIFYFKLSSPANVNHFALLKFDIFFPLFATFLIEIS